MSRSQPAITNPAQHFFTWSGSKGQLEWYNKEKQERIPVKMPFTFMVLDELATIAGFCEPDESSFWANEVRSVVREELTVKTAKGTKEVGLYSKLTDVRSKGAKYAKSIYIAHKVGDDYVLGNIKASGAALTAWIELGQKNVVGNGTVTLTDKVEAKKGTNTYFVPVFEYRSSTDEEDGAAIKLDKQLQVYLSHYLSAAKEETHEPAWPSEVAADKPAKPDMSDPANQPFIAARNRSASKADNVADDQAVQSYQDSVDASYEEPTFDPNDIPF